jgi:acetyl-CoA/propionyl-CoA carboxylase biotin carboxyl carrier protein
MSSQRSAPRRTGPPPFATVLVANRGEIAVRVIRTLQAMGVRAAAVYSDGDAEARHVRDADIAVRLGPAPAADSYLRVDRVVEAALAVKAEALHPGYGFLSENPALPAACAEAGLVFVGPPASAIEAMGDKIRAKAMMAAAGVSVVPGVGAPGMSDDELVAAAEGVGFPLLIKPSAGGGGKGMRLVESPAALSHELAAARREALGAFGDDTLLLERFVERPRHIEVQILADADGQAVHLGERECSLQRRHQKIVEEAPSPLLDDAQRAALGAQAVAAARACGYVNAGTVEFIVSGLDPSDAYFMEMNTRLQVEHPVTELVWGVDLVELQLRIAADEALPFTQADLRPSGHAIEARIYAEDPAAGFLPSSGRVLRLQEPAGPDVRVDSGLLEDAEIGTTYDPLLAKVIAWGSDREQARRRLDDALAGTTVLGVATNVGFVRGLLNDDDVRAGRLDTGLVERVAPALTAGGAPPDAVLAAAVAMVAAVAPAAEKQPADPWRLRDGWRVGEHAWARWAAACGRSTAEIDLRLVGQRVQQRVADEIIDLPWAWLDGGTLELAGRDFAVAREGRTLWIGSAGSAWTFTEPLPRGPSGTAGSDPSGGTVTSPMPGVVVTVHVSPGAEVAEQEPVVTVEAMKMEHAVLAPFEAVVTEVLVAAGQRVALDEPLAVLTRRRRQADNNDGEEDG